MPFAPTCALLIGSFLIANCSSAPTKEEACTAPTHEVHLYITNRSAQDTLAPLRLVIDDSLLVARVLPRSTSSEASFARMVRLCEGTHRLHVEFGRYARDTTFAVRENISLLAFMHYDTTSFVLQPSGLQLPPDTSENGLHIVTLVRVRDTTSRVVN
jgi:hypothetical protein